MSYGKIIEGKCTNYMKRYLVILFALVFSIMNYSIAEGSSEPIIDLSGYTVDELIQLQREVSDALYARNGKVVLPSTDLVVGIDIAPGTYKIEPHNVDDISLSECFTVLVWKSKELRQQYSLDEEEYRVKMSQANEDKDNGKEYAYPVYPLLSNYSVTNSKISSHGSALITLEEGNILTWRSFYKDLELTIEKSNGLFMN